MDKKYPIGLFIFGFLLNLIKNYYLLIPGIILAIIGIWIKTSLLIGVSLLIIDIILAFSEQIYLKKACDISDNPNFQPVKDAIMDKNWRKSIIELVEHKIKEYELEDNQEKTK